MDTVQSDLNNCITLLREELTAQIIAVKNTDRVITYLVTWFRDIQSLGQMIAELHFLNAKTEKLNKHSYFAISLNRMT